MTDTITSTEAATIATTPAVEPVTLTIDLEAMAKTMQSLDRTASKAHAIGPLARAVLGFDPEKAFVSLTAAWALVTGQSTEGIEQDAEAAGTDPVSYLLSQVEAVVEGRATVVLKG